MTRPRLLDTFCKAGGCSVGYNRAGFDVVGVDIEPQPNYPFEFVQADALDVLADTDFVSGFDVIHASPPCQSFSLLKTFDRRNAAAYPDLLDPVRELLERSGLPWVIENVPPAPLRGDLVLCGEMFGLRVHRHRKFEVSGFLCFSQPHQQHRLRGALNNCHDEEGYTRMVVGNYANHDSASRAMGIDWMTRDELREAIPPAYTEYIGAQLLSWLRVPA